MSSQIMLVTGGARSGKSAFAEQQLAALPGPHGYMATAEVYDDEMADRVALHRQRRPASWRTYEVPRQVLAVWPRLMADNACVLVDCLTIYFSNFLYDQRHLSDEAIMERALEELRQWLDAIRREEGKTVIFVTNEIGSGIVPMEHISRLYRDVIGRINQAVAREADDVYWTVCGIPVCIKGPQAVQRGGDR